VGELTPELARFLDGNKVGVVATSAESGRPRQSLVYYAREDDRLLVSTLAQRHKTRDVERTGWASLCVMGHEPPYPSAVFSGAAAILTENIGPATAAIMQRIADLSEPPDPQPDEALADAGRVVLEIRVDRVSAINYLGESAS
jgi:PPOX class probable F420-dependent enzyme